MTPRDRARRIVWIRRVVQGASLALFLGLILATRARVGEEPSGALHVFFDLDPLVLLATWLATHAVAGLSLLALVTVLVTVLLGRVFCGWFCPLGVLNQIFTWLRARRHRRGTATELFSRWQRTKYFLLFALLIMALFGAHWIGIFDPFSLLYRSTVTTVLPAAQVAVEDGATAIYEDDPHVGPLHLTQVSEPTYRFFRDQVFFGESRAFLGTTLILLIFAAALLANFLRPRFWCRYVCPLGALLGLLAKRTPLRLKGRDAGCVDCGLCARSCPAAAQPEKPGEWLPTECFGCWNCVTACRRSAIDFQWEPPWRRPVAGTVDLKKRAVLRSLLGGVGALLLLRLPPQAQARTYNPALIRPPGSRPERDFLQRCIQCGLCMKICPTNALHPTLAEAGLEGLWTPMLVARIGYCDYECNLCGQICPTQAIESLALADKKKVKIGLATIDTTRCLPYAYGRECIVCEEHCPIPNKAIYFVETEIPLRDGTKRKLKLPRVDAELCTGCGICETKCPFRDMAAIRITSANEDRHPDNQPLLPGSSGFDFEGWPVEDVSVTAGPARRRDPA